MTDESSEENARPIAADACSGTEAQPADPRPVSGGLASDCHPPSAAHPAVSGRHVPGSVSRARSTGSADHGQAEWSAEEDTIVAISTAVGMGAIGIVRLSGPEAVGIASRAFAPARGTPVQPDETYVLLYGRVVDPADHQIVDEALLAVMRRPRSYTREDVVELQCHGGPAAQRAVLRLMVRLGARPAEPGEFTRRAFLNGRIDLAQAESVAAIVAARSTGALRVSVRQLDGGLSDRLQMTRHNLLGLLAGLEASVDFSDEDVDEPDWTSVAAGLETAQADLMQLLRTAFLGRALEHGLRTAIVGRPNVGKSSLLNALLMRERAIVSEIPGTTRDTVEELLEIGGIPIQLVDTAGIHSGGDQVEQLGVARSVKAMEQADLVLAVVDLSGLPHDSDRLILAELDPRRTILVGNKSDLVRGSDAVELGRFMEAISIDGRTTAADLLGGGVDSHALQPSSARRGRRAGADVSSDCRAAEPGLQRRGNTAPPSGSGESPGSWRACAVSALTGNGLDGLRAMIQQLVTGGEGFHLEEPILASERQRLLVSEACDSTTVALAGASAGGDEELICEDIRGAIQALGRITGEELMPDLLDEIFSRFCIGK